MATIDLGKLAFVWKNVWNSSDTYEKNDVVVHTDGNTTTTYIYVNASSASNQAPSTGGTINTAYWNKMVESAPAPSGGGGGGGLSWNVITSNTNATTSNGYFIDTSSSAITLTLPASPSAGDQVAFNDYAGNALNNNITIARNSENIQGSATDLVINTNRASNTLVYADATQGWLLTSI